MEKIHNLMLILKYFYENRKKVGFKITQTKLRKSVGKGVKRSILSKKLVDDSINLFLEYGWIKESIETIKTESGYFSQYRYFELTDKGEKLYEKIKKWKNDDDIAAFLALNSILRPV